MCICSSLQCSQGSGSTGFSWRFESHPVGVHDRKHNWLGGVQLSSKCKSSNVGYTIGTKVGWEYLSNKLSHTIGITLQILFRSYPLWGGDRISLFSLPILLGFCSRFGSISVLLNCNIKTIVPKKCANLSWDSWKQQVNKCNDVNLPPF